MKRRDFVKFSSIAAAAIGIGIYVYSSRKKFVLKPVPEGQRLKLGVIGVGSRGNSILEVLRQLPVFKVVAICDIFDFRLTEAKERIDNDVKTFKDFNQLLELRELDAVIISTPLNVHHKVVTVALQRDIHILCEKVMAYNIAECQEIKLKAGQSSKIFQVSYQYQLNPVFQTIKTFIDKGFMGKVTRIEASWDRNGDWRRPLPDISLVNEMGQSELERMINWRMYTEYSGGLNAELGSHQFNMIDSLLGGHPLRVMGTGGIDYWKDGRETFDNVHMLFDYPGGAKVGFHSGTTNQYEAFQLKIYGKKATIVSHNMDSGFIYPEDDALDKNWKEEVDSVTGASIKIIDNDKKRKLNPIESEDIIYPSDNFAFNATWLLYKNFAAAIKGEEELLLGLKDGYQSAISVHMANQAVRNGEIVGWKPEYDV